MPTIRHYKIFQAVVKEENMSKAANKLFVSQPTVSQTISELEQYYQVKLFDRFPKKLFLTDAGRKLYDHVNSLIYQYDNIEALDLNNNGKITIRIGGSHTVSNCILSDILSLANKKDKNLDFNVICDNTSVMEELLLDNQLDFAIVEGTIKNKDIITMPIANDCLVMVVGVNHPFYHKKISLQDLNNQNFILREKGSGTRTLFEETMTKYQIHYNTKWECSSFTTIKDASVNNYGIGVISARLIANELKEESLAIIKVKEVMWKRDLFLCYHKNKTLISEFKPFIDAAISFKIDGVKCPIE